MASDRCFTTLRLSRCQVNENTPALLCDSRQPHSRESRTLESRALSKHFYSQERSPFLSPRVHSQVLAECANKHALPREGKGFLSRDRRVYYSSPSRGELRWQSAVLVLGDVDVAAVVFVGRPCVHHLRLRPTKTPRYCYRCARNGSINAERRSSGVDGERERERDERGERKGAREGWAAASSRR